MIQIAIDGPSGAGKSTLAKALAKKLGFVYVDTGALYRAVGLFCERSGISQDDKCGIVSALKDIELSIEYKEGGQHIILGGEDVSPLIRTPSISEWASCVSAIGEVRDFLLETQRRLARENNVIMDGRDIGTVILPNADVKIFLISSPEARARRRRLEYIEKGIDISLEETMRVMAERDERDSSREVAPLRAADDAIALDSSDMTIDETIDAALAIIESKIGQKGAGK